MITRLVFLFLCCISSVAIAGNRPIKIEGAWLQAVPPVADATAAYMKITNLGQTPLQLVGASSPIAAKIEPMITTRSNRNGQEIMGMEGVEHLEIPAGGVLELKPGGNHLMVMGLVSHPKEGDHVRFSVRFAPGDQQIDVDVAVLRQEPK
jgi:periplasmic copper chaperone A